MEAALMRSPTAPSWVARLDTPVWIRDPDGNVSYLNRRAEVLLGRSRVEAVGLPCHRVVDGIRASGRPFCRRNCPVSRQAAAGEVLPPVSFQVGRGGDASHWLRCLFIPIWTGDRGPSIVHCALDDDRARRITDYLETVAAGGPPAGADLADAGGSALTRREGEVLRHLAAGEDLQAIADELFISHATVRNHVQHILRKLDVHSIHQAVAWHLLRRA